MKKLILIVVCCLWLISCDDQIDYTLESDEKLVINNYQELYDKVLAQNCVSCHGNGLAYEDLNFQSSEIDLFNTNSFQKPDLLLIKAGSPYESYLYNKMLGNDISGDKMPPGVNLSQDVLDAVKNYILNSNSTANKKETK